MTYEWITIPIILRYMPFINSLNEQVGNFPIWGTIMVGVLTTPDGRKYAKRAENF